MDIRKEVEKRLETTETKQLENKFVFAQRTAFGGAGGGGMGAPQVHTKSPAQFAELVPQKEKVYVSLQYPEVESCHTCGAYHYTLKKIYWAFIENRAGIITYEDVYSHREGINDYKRFWIESYDQNTVVFYWDNWIAITICIVFVAVMGSLVLWVLFQVYFL